VKKLLVEVIKMYKYMTCVNLELQINLPVV